LARLLLCELLHREHLPEQLFLRLQAAHFLLYRVDVLLKLS
jgi:hypothetical protein